VDLDRRLAVKYRHAFNPDSAFTIPSRTIKAFLSYLNWGYGCCAGLFGAPVWIFQAVHVVPVVISFLSLVHGLVFIRRSTASAAIMGFTINYREFVFFAVFRFSGSDFWVYLNGTKDL